MSLSHHSTRFTLNIYLLWGLFSIFVLGATTHTTEAQNKTQSDLATKQDAAAKGLVDAGFGDRIMFGSDQMVWPELIGNFVHATEKADFLTEQQKNAILYENAARFFEFDS